MSPLTQAERQLASFEGGDAAAHAIIVECLAEARLVGIGSPQDLLVVAHQLIARGGLTEVVGRSLKVTAIMMGADVTAPSIAT